MIYLLVTELQARLYLKTIQVWNLKMNSHGMEGTMYMDTEHSREARHSLNQQ